VLASASCTSIRPSATSAPPTFYLSATGSDTASGLAPETAWASIAKANTSLPADRSTLLLRRGDTFYGELNLPYGCEVGAYGTGPKPILTMFKLLNQPTGWTEYSPGVWRIDLGSPNTHGGYTGTDDANIGYLMVDGTVKASLKFDLSEVTDAWDFYCDIPNHTLYVGAASNPAHLTDGIMAAPNGHDFGASGSIICCDRGGNDIHDVHVTGTGGCGIRGSGTDVRIRDCIIDYVGGSRLISVGNDTRYGNGIENWTQTRRWTIENNEIAHVYDVAWTAQGRDAGDGPVRWEGLTFRNNHVHDCGQSLEFWSESRDVASPGFRRVIVEGNRFERAGYGAFSDVRPDQEARVHLLTYALQTPVDITIQHNTFDDSWGAYSYHGGALPAGYVTRKNVIRLKPGTRMQHQRPETVEQAATWQAATGLEAGSAITVLPSA
jgi:hypothetical protein